MLLFSQPSTWVFKWETKPGARRAGGISGRRGQNFIVFPGIVELVEKNGRETTLRVLMEPDLEEV